MNTQTPVKAERDWSEIHERETFGPLTLPLALLSMLYGLGVRLRVKAWEKRQRRSLPGFVVSIGNLTVGGTGKTPAAMMLAEWALREGHRVAVLSRGYGGKYDREILEVSDGHDIKVGPREAGDEPCLMATRLQGVPVILARKRYLAGIHAHRRFRSDFFVLDDGYQHLDLKRDLDLVLMDAVRPFGNGHLLPWGPLREPISHLSRADAFLVTGTWPDTDGTGGDLAGLLKGRFPGKPRFDGTRLPDRIVFPNRKEDHDRRYLKGKRILGFAGIAGPTRFRDTLSGLGAEVVSFHPFRDHHDFTSEEIRQLVEWKDRLGASFMVTTEKDWMRLRGGMDHPDLGYLSIRLNLSSNFDGLTAMIRERLHRKIGS
ncbi:MAG: tetraacyldisaccharide 4'-kinase [Deltaproteobacteria bacterium]|nr:tetraacyldisaccharide 4'-kinase [Deltaproteobacteria bacterium]